MKTIVPFLFLIATISMAQAQSELELIDQTLTKNELKSHIEFIASDELLGRAIGEPGIDIAAKYLATQLSSVGVEPVNGSYFQEVAMKRIENTSAAKLTLKKDEYNDLILAYPKDISFEGKAIFIDYGTKEDFENYDVEGKIVITKGGLRPEDELMDMVIASGFKRNWAVKAGAVAMIEIIKFPKSQWQSLDGFFKHRMNVILDAEAIGLTTAWLEDESGELVENLKVGKSIKSKLELSGTETTSLSSKNVLGVIEGSDSLLRNEYIVLSAHYDHLGVGPPDQEGDSIFNGARDNAVGVATMLTTARSMMKFKPKRSVLFAFFTGEESGFLGSKWFCNYPSIPLKDIVYNLNSDNGGYNNTSSVTIMGYTKTVLTPKLDDWMEEANLKIIADPFPEQNFYERSDNVMFAMSGIPAISLSMGLDAIDEEFLKYYHQTADNPESIDYEYLYRYFRSYMNMARRIANVDKKPFWTKDNKFYEKGIDLYDMR